MHGDRELGFHFCPECGCVAYWRALEPDDAGRVPIAVNLRLAEPDLVAQIPIRHFDGLDRWASVDGHARTVCDLWF